jgi:hypothetical protein
LTGCGPRSKPLAFRFREQVCIPQRLSNLLSRSPGPPLSEALLKFYDAIQDLPAAHAAVHSLEISFFYSAYAGQTLSTPILWGLSRLNFQNWQRFRFICAETHLALASTESSHFHTFKQAVSFDRTLIDRITG